MSSREQSGITRRLLVDLGRIAFDAAAEPLGGALPLAPSRLALPQVFNHLLRDHGTDGFRSIEVKAVTPLDLKSISSNCNNLVVSIEHTADRATSNTGALPDTAFVKLPSTQVSTRLFCNMLGIWRNECHFYRHVAPLLPVRTPHAYVVANRRTRFVLVLENLHDADGIELFTNPDMISGASLHTAKKCLSTFASLHARFSQLSHEERNELLPYKLHPFCSPNARAINPTLSRSGLEPARKKAPDLITDDIEALYQRALSRWDDLMAWWFREPLSLIHGDSHLGNFFVAGDEMGMLDWQAVQWGKGIRDVQYFLIDSLPEEMLATHEQELVRYYLSELERHGVALDYDDAWEQYRAFSFMTLMTNVVSLGVGAMTEMEEVLPVVLARSVAAVRRVRFSDWLDELAKENGYAS